MAHCPSCGGIIGKDCFNPVECAWITQQQDQQQPNFPESNYDEIIHNMQEYIESLEKRILDLEHIAYSLKPL